MVMEKPNRIDECCGMITMAIHSYYWYDLGDKKMIFYKNGCACNCKICDKYQLFWGDFENYEYNHVDIDKDMKVNEMDLDAMVRLNKDLFTQLFSRKDLSLDYDLKLFLGLYYDTDLLPENFRKKTNLKRLLDFLCAPYIFMIHKDHTVSL